MTVIWRCSAAGLRGDFWYDVDKLLADLPDTWYVLSGYRSMEEQQELYEKYLAGGPKAAPPGRSAHNYGLAVDVVLDADGDKPGLQPSWDTKLPAWLRLRAVCYKHPRLKNGWSFGDWPHIERFNWRKFA